MYIHIGWNQVVHEDDVMAIIKYEKSDKSKGPLRHFKNQEIIEIHPEDAPKTYIVTKDKIYISSVSITTIMKRIKNNSIYKYK